MKRPGPLSRRGRHALIFLLGMAVTAVVLVLVWAIVIGATNSQESNQRSESREPQVAKNDQTLAAVRANTRVIKDCTQVGGKCYERGQRQQAAILFSAQRIILASAVCAVDLDAGDPVSTRVQQITSCVNAQLARRPSKRP